MMILVAENGGVTGCEAEEIVEGANSMYDEYRGYRIKVMQAEYLTATIWPPGKFRCLDARPTATSKEGKLVLLDRVRAAIDNEIAKSQPVTNPRSAGRRR